MIALTPNGYLACGTTESFSGSKDIFLMKIQEDGSVDFSIRIGDAS